MNESFCVTGSDDGYLRLWPLDFKQVLLEAQHDGPVTAVDISNDCMRILAATSTVCFKIGQPYVFIIFLDKEHEPSSVK